MLLHDLGDRAQRRDDLVFTLSIEAETIPNSLTISENVRGGKTFRS